MNNSPNTPNLPNSPTPPIAVPVESSPISPIPTPPTPPPNLPNIPNLPNSQPFQQPQSLKSPPHPLPEAAASLQAGKKLLYLGSFIVLIVSLSLLSFFFLKNQRQPKTNSRAAAPSSIISPTTLISLTPPTSTRSGFSSLISSDKPSSSSSIATISLTAPTSPSSPDSSPQPTANDQRPTTNERPSRVIFDITAAQNLFKPNQFEAFNNQIIVFNVFATDKDYDIAIPEFGVKKVFKQGTRFSMEFQATSTGLYTFTCTDNCTGSDTAKGLLTIKP